MAISVKYFASLREKLGRGEDHLAADGIATARDVWNRGTGVEPPPKTLVAINLEYAKWDSPVRDGDEVAFFPPVTGG
jgi:molybdopterin synthase sulfur carrier subunit